MKLGPIQRTLALMSESASFVKFHHNFGLWNLNKHFVTINMSRFIYVVHKLLMRQIHFDVDTKIIILILSYYISFSFNLLHSIKSNLFHHILNFSEHNKTQSLINHNVQLVKISLQSVDKIFDQI